MDRWTRVTLVFAATAAFAGFGLGGCVSGDIPPQQQASSDGSALGDGVARAEASAEGSADDGGSTSTGDGGNSSDAMVDRTTDSTTVGVADAGIDAAHPGSADGSSEAAGDATTPSADGATADGSRLQEASVDGSASEAGALASCVNGIFGSYVVRSDGKLLFEGTQEQTILDANTGLPLTGVQTAADGLYHGCAALTDGTVQCWRTDAYYGNFQGQIGNGTTDTSGVVYRATPVLTAASTPLTNVATMVTGKSDTACAITKDAKLYCWGELTWAVNGGRALTSGYAQPITIDGTNALTGVLQASVGASVGCAVVKVGATNELRCWGYNGNYELAQGDTTTRQYPVQILGLTAPSQVAVSLNSPGGVASTVCVLDGTNVRCWGYNSYGAVGANTATSPVQGPMLATLQGGATPLDGVTDLEPGFLAFCVTRNDHSLWCWGASYQGYPGNYGVTNVVGLGWAGGAGYAPPLFLTSDGVYHKAMTTQTINCGAL